MSRLGLKIFVRMSLVVMVVFALTYATNRYLLPKYMVYQHKAHLSELVGEIEKLGAEAALVQIERLAHEYDVTLIHTPYVQDENELNENVRYLLNRQGITLSKFWISSWSMEELNHDKTVMKLYNQEKLNTSFLVAFVHKEGTLFVMGDTIAHAMDPLAMANQFYVYITLGGLVLTIALSWLVARRIVKPLAKLGATAEQISRLSFQQAEVKTGDEIEALAHSINKMSANLEQSHQALQDRNDNLRTFISNISHEVKTPLALIKAYTLGMKDGLDDGTYLDVIEQQTDEIQHIVDKLLHLSRMQTEDYALEQVEFRALLQQCLMQYKLALEQAGLAWRLQDEAEQTMVQGDAGKLLIVLDNLMSNAVSYASGTMVAGRLYNEGSTLVFCLRNHMLGRLEGEIEKLWEPFYVGEPSRHKQRSGTGLGLSIVRAILHKHGASAYLTWEDGQFSFEMKLPLADGSSDAAT